jgi:hypothetical protein
VLQVCLRALDKTWPVAPGNDEHPIIEPAKALAGSEQAVGVMQQS